MNSFQLKKVKGLGRGLSSLLGDAKSKTNITKLKIYDVKRNRLQPRKVFNQESLQELTNSIKERGVIQPIIVRKDKSLVGKFEIIAGERRWLASQNAGLNEIPVVILDVDDERTLEFAIVENVQRQDLNAIEEAQGYQRLIDEFSYDQVKLAKFIGKSRSYIANSLRLLGLPKEVISYVENEKISASHARSLIGLPNAMQIAQKIAENKLSVRQSENLVRALRNKRNFKVVPSKDGNILDLEKSLVDKTGINVEIKNNRNNSGKLSFEYKNLEQLDRLVNIALPRIKDFQGLSVSGFDNFGNYSFGIKEHIIFPEIDFDKVNRIRGMDITLVTTGRDKKTTLALLEAMNFPFSKKIEKKGINWGDMAKTSSIQRNLKRIKLVKKFLKKRENLKKIIKNKKLPLEERFAAQLKLAKIPRNSAKVRIRNRCEITGRPHGVYRKLRISRIALRDLASKGKIPGMTKSSW